MSSVELAIERMAQQQNILVSRVDALTRQNGLLSQEIKGLKKASNSHKKQAKVLTKAIGGK